MTEQSDYADFETRRKGRLRVFVGALLVVLGSIWSLAQPIARRFAPDDPFNELAAYPPVVPILLLISLIAFRLIRQGKRYLALASAGERLAESRSPIVLLRPFKSDRAFFESLSQALLTGNVLRGFETVEEQLALAVEPIGPLVAIGEPGEQLPTLGAARAYVEGDWHTAIRDWLSRATLVIIKPGMSDGLWWEIELVVSSVEPERVLLLMQRMGRVEYDTFRSQLRRTTSLVLPAFDAVRRWRRVAGFMAFRHNWIPEFLPFRLSYWRRDFSPHQMQFRHALMPLMRARGIDVKRIPISRLKVAWTILVAYPIAVSALLLADSWPRIVDRVIGNPGSDFVAPISAPVLQGQPARARKPALNWTTRIVSGVSIQAPGSLVAVPMPPATLDSLKFVESIEVFAITSDVSNIGISRYTYREGVTLSPEGAATGEFRSLVEEIGSQPLDSATSRAVISGHQAIRLSAHFDSRVAHLSVETTTFSLGRRIWQVRVVVWAADSADAIARRISESVTIAASR